MSGYDDLERQLRESVRERAAGPAPDAPPEPPRRRARGRRRPLILIAVPAVLVAGVATAATQLGGEHSVGYRADRLVLQASARAAADPACREDARGVVGPVVDTVPEARITSVLPQLASAPATAPDRGAMRVARMNASGGVLGSTVRTVSFPGGATVLLFVTRGQGLGGFRDPVGCRAATHRALAEVRDRTSPPVYAAAERILGRTRAFVPGSQTLHVLLRSQGGWVGGGGEPTRRPGRTLKTGVYVGGAGRPGHPTTYAGIVRPDVALVRIDPAPGTKTRVHRTARPKQGVFAFTLPRIHGRMVVREYDAAGRLLRSSRSG
jgi:hypothetical protein